MERSKQVQNAETQNRQGIAEVEIQKTAIAQEGQNKRHDKTLKMEGVKAAGELSIKQQKENLDIHKINKES